MMIKIYPLSTLKLDQRDVSFGPFWCLNGEITLTTDGRSYWPGSHSLVFRPQETGRLHA